MNICVAIYLYDKPDRQSDIQFKCYYCNTEITLGLSSQFANDRIIHNSNPYFTSSHQYLMTLWVPLMTLWVPFS